MTLQCTSTADAITSVLLAGDAVLNLSRQPLNAAPGTLFVCEFGNQLALSNYYHQLRWNPSYAGLLPTLITDDITRLVVVSDEQCPDAEKVIEELAARQIPHCHCVLTEGCAADAFMDEEDADAVTERLRQLGYI